MGERFGGDGFSCKHWVSLETDCRHCVREAALGVADGRELRRRLRVLADLSRDDAEAAHMEADAILLRLIDEPEVTKAFEAIKKWYA